MRYSKLTTYALSTVCALGFLLIGIASPAKSGERKAQNLTSEKATRPAVVSSQKEGVRLADNKKPTDRRARVSGPKYVPPTNTQPAPGSRKGGATRGPEGTLPMIAVLVPEQTGLTVEEQPTLYWYVSSVKPTQVVFNLILDTEIKSLVEETLTSPSESGVQRVRLADYDVHLEVGKDYYWHIALVPDPEDRSKDIVASGAIRRIQPKKGIINQVAKAQGTDLANVYAESGLWYDALRAISDRIASSPANTELRMERAALLEQIGLPEVATYERSAVRGITG